MASTGTQSKGKEDDPYCLHNSDHPGMSLVNTALDGRNYFAWSIAIRTALEAKDKVGFIDGSLPSPKDATKFKKWKTVDSMIKSWLVNSLTKELADIFVCCYSSKNLWDTLEERYGSSNGPHLYQIQQEISSTRQGGGSVTTYYNKIKRGWDEMDRVYPMPTCTCGKCTCELKKKITNLLASMKLLQFLMGLNPVYDVVRTQILNLDPLPAVNKAYNMVITDEAQRETRVESSTFKKGPASKKDKYCTHCNVNGHTKETCFKLHGYPDWFKELKEKRAGKKVVAANVKDSGNTEASAAQNNDSSSNADLASAVSYLLKEVQRLGKAKTTTSKDEQVNFANLYDFAGKTSNQNSLDFKYTHWIIDTGATTHMCCNATHLQSNPVFLQSPPT
ncbi:uncharacterized protein G2W53_012931 [Senna tora]|uniref:Retrotransposon Copia-like N-terminal domain-containing protein n=1 Tax=Senna tora TaxID=362788 RepID=A0A834WQW7_9FABA|nr:uncharacterized protein G2W53_012931 [Senna tora]